MEQNPKITCTQNKNKTIEKGISLSQSFGPFNQKQVMYCVGCLTKGNLIRSIIQFNWDNLNLVFNSLIAEILIH